MQRDIKTPRSVRDIALVLIIVGVGLVLLLSPPTKTETGPFTRALFTVTGPFQQAITSVHHWFRDSWGNYVALMGVREENRKLKAEVNELRRERTVLLGKERENQRLKKLLDLKSQYDFPSVAAQIIGQDSTGWYGTLFINRGTEDGIKEDMTAVVAQGVVGRLIACSSRVSKVLMITDSSLSVDCRVTRTRDRGILSGHLDGGCILRYVDSKSSIKAGDEVVTSGLDGIFPKGLTVGVVKSVRAGAHGLFLEALVTPSVDFDKVEEVLVVLGRGGGFDTRPGLEDNR
ncbi:rod shape-determining protein MreC [Thermodesulfobacteriota bacterium]